MKTSHRSGRRLLALILSLLMMISMLPISAIAVNFPDAESHWAKDVISKWSDYGVILGDETGFRPDGAITRGEFAVIVDRVMKYQTAAPNTFSDMSAADWYADSILKLNAAGVMNGVGGGKADPTGTLTRQQAMVMLARMFSIAPDTSSLNGFSDAGRLADWARELVGGMVKAGYVQGSGGMLNPEDSLTRAEAVKLFDSIIKGFYYEPGTYTINTDGIVVANTSGVVLENSKAGTIFVSPGIKKGDFTYRNSSADKITVMGGGVNSIILDNSIVEALDVIIDASIGDVRINAIGGTSIHSTFIEDTTETVILTGGIDTITVGAGATVIIRGDAASVEIIGDNVTIIVEASGSADRISVTGNSASITAEAGAEIGTVTVSANGASVSGDGKVSEVKVTSGTGTEVTTPNTSISVSEGAGSVSTGDGNVIEPGKTDKTDNNTQSGGNTGGGYTPPPAGQTFASAKAEALSAITAANLPTAASLAGKTIVIPNQEIIKWPQYMMFTSTPAVTDLNKLPFTSWPEVGIPAITSAYGNKAATGIFALIDTMKNLAPAGYDINTDPDFAAFLGFAEKYTPAAIAGTSVAAKKVYVVTTEATAVTDDENDPDGSFTSTQPYKILDSVIEVGKGEMTGGMRILDCIPTGIDGFALGPLTHDYISTFVYEVGINNEGIVVSYDRIPTDNVQSYGTPSSNKIRVGYYSNEMFNIATGAKAYFISASAPGAPLSVSSTSNIADLTGDWGNNMRYVFNDSGEIVEAYITIGTGSQPVNLAETQKYEYIHGVKASDPEFGYDGIENPYPVDFALYDPIKDETNTGANDPNALYPLFIFCHGIGGGGNKNGLLDNDAGIGRRYIKADYQALFETNTVGVTGAYVMLPRASEYASLDLGSQGWLHGFRGTTNPRYAAGDEAYKGKPTQTAALVADILWLIENKNIDPDRIYLTGFSAGGYMAWQTLFEGGDLFAAASPQGAAFFPNGAQLPDDYSEIELGLKNKILSVKDIPIWLIHSRNDGTCGWDITIGDNTITGAGVDINGNPSLWGSVRSLSDGTSPIQGNALTRVTIHNDLKNGTGASQGSSRQHSPQLMLNNNVYVISNPIEGITPYFYDAVYGTKGSYNEAAPTSVDTASLYSYGINPDYSTAASYGDTFIAWLNACGDARQALSNAIEAAIDAINNLPAAASIVPKNPAAGQTAYTDQSLLSFLGTPYVPEVPADPGFPPYVPVTPAIPAVPATGVFKLVYDAKALGAADSDITNKAKFDAVVAAMNTAAKTVFETQTVYVTSVADTDVTKTPNSDTSYLAYNEYASAYEISGDNPTARVSVKVSKAITLARPGGGLGPYSGIYMKDAGIYKFGFNAEGIAVELEQQPFDPYTGYGAPDTVNKTIRIGQFGAAEGDAYNMYKYDENTKVYIVTGNNASLTLTEKSITELLLDENDTVRIFYNYTGMNDKTLTEVFISETANAGSRATTYANRHWSEGVKWDDPDFGYDGVENPFPVQFSLYNPIEQASKPDTTKYPLLIFFHGIGGGATKTGVADNPAGYNYASTDYQSLFDTDTPDVHGAYVMSARANEFINPGISSQGWLMGYRSDSNPRYAMDDAAYKGKATQAAALIANIEWLIENENIDPDRIYLTSHSAGGYMVWAVLFEAARQGKSDLIAGAIPNQAAFFPSGGQLETDYSEVELGLEDKLIAVKNTPIWLLSSLTDGTCGWGFTAGDTFRMTSDATVKGSGFMGFDPPFTFTPGTDENVYVTMDKLGGADTLWKAVTHLKTIGGSPLTRVSISVNMAHMPTIVQNNNTWPAETAQRESTSPTSYTKVYAEQPEGFNEASPGTDLAYTFGASSVYSDGSYEDTIIEWFNACAAARKPAVETAIGNLNTEIAKLPDISKIVDSDPSNGEFVYNDTTLLELIGAPANGGAATGIYALIAAAKAAGANDTLINALPSMKTFNAIIDRLVELESSAAVAPVSFDLNDDEDDAYYQEPEDGSDIPDSDTVSGVETA